MKKKETKKAGVQTARRLAAAAVLYGAVVWYFFGGHDYQRGQWLVVINWVAGAMGCFVLSRRWIGAFGGSFFAGAVYGFSPLAIGLAAYHPLAGTPLAIVPWLLCPATFWRKWAPRLSRGLRRLGRGTPAAVTAGLCLLPFAGVAGFFWVCRQSWMGPVFPLPKGASLEVGSLAGLVIPLAMRPHELVVGFYHVPTASLVMGLCMYFVSGRIGAMLIAGAGAVLSFAGSVMQVHPVAWASIPLLFGAIVIGLGMEGLAWAGSADGRWLLLCAAVTGVITGACVYMSVRDGAAYRQAALLHAGGLLAVGVIYALTRAQLRLHLLRWSLLGAAMGVDLLSSGKQLADMVL